MKQFAALILTVLVCHGALALEVDRKEIQVDPSARVRFENYEGTPSKIETADQIRGIGEALGANLAVGGGSYFDRYRIVHAVDPKTSAGFDADIFILEKNALVDHIRNLRLMIAGYLSAAYGYGARDSYTLAEFITVYNAVYRKNLEYFASKFKPVVLSHLAREKAGLALSYREWPGASQIVIPLSDPAKGSLGAVETGAISDKSVVAELRTRDDRGVELRKEMVDIKERRIAGEEQKAAEAEKALREERSRLAEREEQVRRELEEARQAKKTLEEEAVAAKAAAAGETPAVEEAKAAEKAALDAKEEVLARRQAEIAAEKESLARRETEAKAAESWIAETKEEVRRDRREIAADQQAILGRETGGAVLGIPFIKAEAGWLGKLVLVDPKTGAVLTASPEPPLSTRAFERFGGGLAVILARTGGGGRLAILETSTLKEKIAAREDVYPKSIFKVNGSELYAVIRDSGTWRLGKYDPALALLARSKAEVNPDTFLVFSDAHVFVEGRDGGILPLTMKALD